MYTPPEQPLLVYPSKIAKYGAEAAILLARCEQLAPVHGLADGRGGAVIRLDAMTWEQWLPQWSFDTLCTIARGLDERNAIRMTRQGQMLSITLVAEEPASSAAQPPTQLTEKASKDISLPVVDADAAQAAPVTQLRVLDKPPITNRGGLTPRPQANKNPPAFGGSAGWQRGESDELHRLFSQREERNQNLHEMFMEWQPSNRFFEMLASQGISVQFAQNCRDEFVLYWTGKDRREASWDQKFLSWVKREWVKQQTREQRESRAQQDETRFKHEDARRDTRENRKRLSQAIMDIKDTDW
ncbi:MAG: DnaT-like ssDNA-binding domain-containing protein [Pontibacterium sp.]